ncbi:EAL domain-containing protein [Marinospirillum alkaliphilum]|uniref:PAS domain S-box-containing protein/diguanylate cyclase (GGDEF) domain-containing protein n=1 Tax=Marinospirillum alkaliphilum DSM 21637 TaxID=1122209 RepID=A0A1K1WZ64_9GAMM|nr:EAL domain-containing protein [Marinospirillum alkaliphilum]SFX42674.1 PAS domain S-box-containing protein/diguanylate cyclase (GGDEF) domain-containing protein [Marinospirillum alkaliphilum DSM 21637]
MSIAAQFRANHLPWLILLVGGLLSLWLASEVRNKQEKDAVERFSFAADQVTQRLEERLDAYALVLRGGAGLFDASMEVTRDEWQIYADKMRVSKTVANIHGIGFAERIPAVALDEHLQRIREEGFADYHIWPAGERPFYTTTLFIEPFERRNRRSMGYDMWTDSVRREAMIRARDTGMAALSGKVQLVAEEGDQVQTATLMFVPVYQQEVPVATPEQRQQALIGWTFSPYRMDELMQGILSGWERLDVQALGLHLYDGDQPLEHQRLFSSHQANGSLFYQQRLLEFNGRQWLLVFDHFNPASGVSYLSAWVTLTGGLILTGLVFWLLRLLQNIQVNARKLADQLTREIRQHYEESRRFRKALDYVSSYIYMKDTKGGYTYANQITLDLFGVTQESLKGTADTDYFPPATVRHLQQIDRRVLQGEQSSEEVEIPFADGRVRHYLEIKTPIHDDSDPDKVIGLLGISTDITEMKEHERQLEHVAHYDALTNLPNRVLLADRLSQAMVQAQRRGQRVAVVYLDLDGFKAINDCHGHAVGDEILMTLAGRMKDALREGDTLSRLGGDEFVAVLLDLPDTETATPLLQRLLAAASRPVMLGSEALAVTASLGVTFYPQSETLEAEQLLRQADQAMYQAKLAGKGRYHLFDAEEDRSVRSHHESLERIQVALRCQEFVLHYQPKVNMRTGAVIGVEALVRWQHPQRGLLPPSAFLPVIEEHPLALQLGEWVIGAALFQMTEWQSHGLTLPVSINVGARQLRQGELPLRLQGMLARYPAINPSQLELEILETSALGDLAQVAEILEACRKLGVGISLDDFGTGYSSLTYLKRLPAGMVKVDQSFIRDVLDNPEDLAILNGVMSLAAAFGRQVIAEGVETEAHGDMLLRIGCELAQGYGIARPMAADLIPAWVSNWQPSPHWRSLKRVSQPDLPLVYAALEHRAWVQNLLDSLETGRLQDRPPLDENECRFGRWLQESGWGQRSDLQSVNELHQQIHQLAHAIYRLQDAGHFSDVPSLVEELLQLRDRLLEQLELLQQH